MAEGKTVRAVDGLWVTCRPVSQLRHMDFHMLDIAIRDQTIDLDQLLKLSGAIGTGGQAKIVIQDGLVKVNGQLETRRRRTIKIGDVVEIEGASDSIRVTGSSKI
jgi:ribosome-associated protein